MTDESFVRIRNAYRRKIFNAIYSMNIEEITKEHITINASMDITRTIEKIVTDCFNLTHDIHKSKNYTKDEDLVTIVISFEELEMKPIELFTTLRLSVNHFLTTKIKNPNIKKMIEYLNNKDVKYYSSLSNLDQVDFNLRFR